MEKSGIELISHLFTTNDDNNSIPDTLLTSTWVTIPVLFAWFCAEETWGELKSPFTSDMPRITQLGNLVSEKNLNVISVHQRDWRRNQRSLPSILRVVRNHSISNVPKRTSVRRLRSLFGKNRRFTAHRKLHLLSPRCFRRPFKAHTMQKERLSQNTVALHFKVNFRFVSHSRRERGLF